TCPGRVGGPVGSAVEAAPEAVDQRHPASGRLAPRPPDTVDGHRSATVLPPGRGGTVSGTSVRAGPPSGATVPVSRPEARPCGGAGAARRPAYPAVSPSPVRCQVGGGRGVKRLGRCRKPTRSPRGRRR